MRCQLRSCDHKTDGLFELPEEECSLDEGVIRLALGGSSAPVGRRPFSRASPYACLYVRTLYLPCGGPGLALEDVVVLEPPFDSLDFFQALRPRRCGSFALEPALGWRTT